jgi:hypothetical protein
MKIIALTSNYDGELIYINTDLIGHIYDEETYTVVGTTTHNNGGFKVKENAKTILNIINEFTKVYK